MRAKLSYLGDSSVPGLWCLILGKPLIIKNIYIFIISLVRYLIPTVANKGQHFQQ